MRSTLGTIAWLGLSSLAAAGEALSADLDPPVRLEADGKPIDHGAAWGHAGPCVFDVDGDGKRDLVVGDFGGAFTLYRNVGADDEPRYESAGPLKAGDEPAKVRIYCCIGSSPQFADLDGDGNADLISGSYDPGACYWFPGNGDGTFRGRDSGPVTQLARGLNDLVAKATAGEAEEPREDGSNGIALRDRAGKVILRKPGQKEEWESYGSWPFAVDWDTDGDLDLVIGGFDGTVWLRENLGTATDFAFGETPVAVEAGGGPIGLKSEGMQANWAHAAVVAADWDGDGLFDLVTGCDDGSVRWFRNVGAKGKPEFAAAERLVPPHEGSGYDAFVEPGGVPKPGIRSQVAVADMNGDEKPDLLVGDFSQTQSPRADLSPEDRRKYEEALARHVVALEAFQKRNKAAWDEGQAYWKTFPEEEQSSDAVQEKWRKKMDELRALPEYVAAKEAYEAGQKGLSAYLAKAETKSLVPDEFASPHGFVWLYLRK